MIAQELNRLLALVLSLVAQFLLVLSSVQAQPWKTFLQQEAIPRLTFDKQAQILWLGTDSNELWRYDGQDFDIVDVTSTIEGLHSININSLFADFGLLWIGTNSGIICYNHERNESEIFRRGDGLVSDSVSVLHVDDLGNLWYGTPDSGVGKYDGQNWYRYDSSGYYIWDSGQWNLLVSYASGSGLAQDGIESINHDGRGNKYFGTNITGLFVLDNSDTLWTHVTLTDTTSGKNRVLAIAVDNDEHIWLGTLEGIFVLNSNFSIIRMLTSPEQLADNRVSAIWIDEFQNKWIGTDNGITLLDSTGFRGKTFRSATQGLGPASNIVHSIIGDTDGNLWFGFFQIGGVSKYNNKWAHLTEDDNLLDNRVRVFEIAEDERLWVAPEGMEGLQALGRRSSWINTAPSCRQHTGRRKPFFVFAIERGLKGQRGHVWVGTACGLFGMHIENSEIVVDRVFHRLNALLPSNLVLSIATKIDSVLWIGMDRGLCRLANIFSSEVRCETFPLDSLGLSTFVNKIIIDRSYHVWIATSAGLGRYDGHSWTVFDSQFPQTPINALAADSAGAIWVGTDLGISRLSENQWTTFTTTDGLPNNSISAIGVDPQGGIWCGTPGGAAVFDSVSQLWTSYTVIDGLSDNFITDISFGIQNVIWFSTLGGGLSRFHRTEVRPQTKLITDFDITSNNNVTFEFTGFDLNTPTNQLRYSYKMDYGPWSKPSFATFATLRIEKKGRHTFSVKALDKDNNEDRYPATRSFYKVPPDTGSTTVLIDTSGIHGFETVKIKLYWPPNQLLETSQISILPVPLDSLDKPAVLAYDLQPFNTDIRKKGVILTFEFTATDLHAEDTFFIVRALDSQGQNSTVLGGTTIIDADTLKITTSIEQLGRYAVVVADSSAPRQPEYERTRVNAQPRIFSPSGDGHGRETTLSFQLPRSTQVRIRVYNLAGRLVNTILNRQLNAGVNAVVWNGKEQNGQICPSGLYIMTIESHVLSATKKVMVLNE